MADILDNIFDYNPESGNPDIASELRAFRQDFARYTIESTQHDKNVENLLRSIASSRNGGPSSASFRQSRADQWDTSFRDPFGRSRGRYGARRSSGIFDDIVDEFQKTMWDEFKKSKWGKQVRSFFDQFARDLGTSIEDIPKGLGRELGKRAMHMARGFGQNNASGRWFTGRVNSFFDNMENAYMRGSGRPGQRFSGFAKKTARSYTSGGSGTALVSTNGIPINPSALGLASGGDALGGLSAMAGEAAAGLGALVPAVLAAKVALSVWASMFDHFYGNVKESWDSFKKSMLSAFYKDNEMSRKRIQTARERLEADVETMIKEPFNILKEAAQEIYNVWDQQLRTITATQGYNKADVQDLMAVYAQRLREEGLTTVVSGADIVDNLSKVIQSGLSGAVAEEFAYIATVLNAAIPTQDFFSYASSYASLAANMIASGKSQTEAIAEANEMLQEFAHSVLYTSRELTGGFSTGLQNASNLFESAVKITQAAKGGRASSIAGVLTAVSGVTGALAPDLASTMVDAVVKAALGGNEPSIVALRSLANVNASNTEFLKMLANDPQKLFATLFANLSQMQKMQNDAFMEVAEGLSSVFGVSMDAFARLDFIQLANAVANMNLDGHALEQNMQLLISGQTTTSAEQLKMQQINQYMIEEGLSYVVDNAAARMIQEHMWDQEIAMQITEAEYGVNLVGSTYTLLNDIYELVHFIAHPISTLVNGVFNIQVALDSGQANVAKIGRLLQSGKVGTASGRKYDLSQTQFNSPFEAAESYIDWNPQFLKLLPSLDDALGRASLDRMGIPISQQASIADLVTLYSGLASPTISGGIGASSPSSKYRWKSISKSLASYFYGTGTPTGSYVGRNIGTNATSLASSSLKRKIDEMLAEDYMRQYMVEGSGGYAAWTKSAASKGIVNLGEALKSIGYAESDVKKRFEQEQLAEEARKQIARDKKEEDFWQNVTDFNSEMILLIKSNNEQVEKIYAKHSEFFDAWTDYFVKHSSYRSAYDYEGLSKVLQKEKLSSEDAIYKLVDTLTAATNFDDPQLQTNVLLAQILNLLKVVITQQSNSPTLTLPDTYASLSMGATLSMD